MIRKRTFLIIIIICFYAGCDDFLDTQNYMKKDTANFPSTQEDATQMTTGVYSALKSQIGYLRSSHFFVAEMAGDDRLGGGSRSNRESQAIDRMQYSEESQFRDFWRVTYSGIFRANSAIATINNVSTWNVEGLKEQYLGEIHFLRALYYFQLVQLFGEVPLLLNPEPENKPKATAHEIYFRIASDLLTAIDLLPAKHYTQIESGRATRWASEALLARIFLFYTGYYKQKTLPTADGAEITSHDVITYLEDCIHHSGHELVSDFRNIWAYSNQWTKPDYPYSSANDLEWAGDGCRETIFAIKFGNHARNEEGKDALGYSNQLCLNFGLRYPGSYNDEKCFPFGQGWAIGTINPTLWKEWLRDEPDDIRREGTIMSQQIEMPPDWSTDRTKQVEETGYWGKKYIPVLARDETGKIWKSYSCPAFGTAEDYQTSHTNDLILIRLADVYLMHSELSATAQGINIVRERAGLDPVTAYSSDALKRERRYELATEGLRWWDLLRWHEASAVIPENQEGVIIKVIGTDNVYTSSFASRFVKTGGFFPIPESQVILSNGVLKQNPGWLPEDKDAYFENLPY